MAENTYNWQSMDYKELSFVDKHLDMSLPEQAELRQQLRNYTAGRVKAFADGSALIQNAAEYKLIYGLINDQNLNGSAMDGGKASTEALQAFAKVKGFKNTVTGELDIYDPRCGMSAEEFKAAMLKPVREQGADYKPDGVSGMEIADIRMSGGCRHCVVSLRPLFCESSRERCQETTERLRVSTGQSNTLRACPRQLRKIAAGGDPPFPDDSSPAAVSLHLGENVGGQEDSDPLSVPFL